MNSRQVSKLGLSPGMSCFEWRKCLSGKLFVSCVEAGVFWWEAAPALDAPWWWGGNTPPGFYGDGLDGTWQWSHVLLFF